MVTLLPSCPPSNLLGRANREETCTFPAEPRTEPLHVAHDLFTLHGLSLVLELVGDRLDRMAIPSGRTTAPEKQRALLRTQKAVNKAQAELEELAKEMTSIGRERQCREGRQ